MTNYYHVLGLNESASPAQIKSAFKKLAVQFHPDKHAGRPEMEEKFKEINEAHQVLSDPYEKARYDLKLKYQQFTENDPTPTYQSAYPKSAHYRRYRQAHYRPRMDSKTNIKATAYAFGITFLLASIIMAGLWVKESYDDKKLAEFIAERRTLYLEAKNDFDKEQYDDAFVKMSNFTYFRSDERDIRIFKESMINKMIEFGDNHFFSNQFDSAIRYYEMIQEFQPNNPFYILKKRLAIAYRKTKQYQKSKMIIEGLLEKDYEVVQSLVSLAELHKDQSKFQDAKLYYDVGHKVAKKQYEEFFGIGYPIVIKNDYLPISHYHLYAGIADNYLKMNNPKMAIKAADWNKYVWPDSTDAYVVSGNAYLLLNQPTNACKEFIDAMNLGWNQTPPIDCFE